MTRDRLTFDRYLVVVRRAYLSVELAPPEMNEPASEAAIAALEKAVGHSLPGSVRKAWLVADGQASTPEAPLFWETDDGDDARLVGYDFLSVEQAHEAHARPARRERSSAEDAEPRDSRIADGGSLPGWLPFADFGAGTMQLLIDFTPTPMGTVGQVIGFTEDPADMRWIADSFDAFLASSFAALESDPEYVLQDVTQDGDSVAGRRERRDDRE